MSGHGVSRRRFLQLSGVAGTGLMVGLRLRPGGLAASGLQAADSFQPNAWINVAPDGIVTLMVDEMEMGQGVITSIPMILAEELDVAWHAVRVEYGPTDPSTWPRGISTGGSTSVRTAWDPLRTAGAQAREMLTQAAAQRWGVEPGACTTRDGEVRHQGSNRRLGYGELTEEAALLPVPEEPRLKDPSEYRILGRRIPRDDTPAKTDGSQVFGMDVRLPGMLVATIMRSPVFGGRNTGFDASRALALPGVRSVFAVSSGVAVVAVDTWSAIQGREALTGVTWDEGPVAAIDSVSLEAALRGHLDGEGAVARDDGDVAAALAGADVLESEYYLPYLAHATMEPMNATAHIRADGAEVWAPTQNATNVQSVAAEVTGLEPSSIVVHSLPMGGGFGRRSNTDFAREAVEVAREFDVPVKVVWTREDDTRGGWYRPVSAHRLRAVLNADGTPRAWSHHTAAASIFHGLNPAILERSGGVDRDAVNGARQLPYTIPNVRVEYSRESPGIPVWFWRSVGHSTNGFTTESFIDELAHRAEVDPFEYRRTLLQESPRHLGVLETVADAAGWGSSLPAGRARGISVHESFGSFVAQVAEVSLEEGRLRVHRVVCAVDCGQNINPDTIEAQMDSSIAYGLTAALYGEVTLKNGRVLQSNFHDYLIARMNVMPRVETHIVQSGERPGGIGEAGLPPLAPAVTNAIFAASGQRIRRLPIADQLQRGVASGSS